MPAGHLAVGAAARARVPARDVILATEAPAGLSVHNVLRATATRLDEHAGHVVAVQLAIGDSRLLAEVTSEAVGRLAITPGASLIALVKSVSIEVVGLTASAGPAGDEASVAPVEGR